MNRTSKAQQIAGWILTVLLSVLFLGSAAIKLIGAFDVQGMMQKWGLGEQVTLIGVGEAVSALLLSDPAHAFSRLAVINRLHGRGDRHAYAARGILCLAVGFSGLDLGCRFSAPPQVLQSFFPKPKLKTASESAEH